MPEFMPAEEAQAFDQGVLPEPPLEAWRPVDLREPGAELSRQIAESLGCEPEELVQVPKVSLVLYAAETVTRYLSGSPAALALVQEQKMPASPDRVAWMSAMGVLYPLSGTSLGREEVADLIDAAGDSRGELLVLTSRGRFDPFRDAVLEEADLEQLFAAAEGLVLGACDGESHLIWRRASGAGRRH